MKKKIAILFLSIIALGHIYAQDNIHASGEVQYIVTCIKDTIKKEVLTDTFCLRYNSNQSLFYNKEVFMMDSFKRNDIEAWRKKCSLDNIAKVNQSYYVLLDLQEGTYMYEELIGTNKYRYTENIPSFEWKITNEKKNIGGHKCKKATTTFRGRTYIAWFATDIKEQFGPWKLCGLPGLILEAHDAKEQYCFKFLDIHSSDGIIEKPTDKAFISTFENFMIEKQKYLEDPIDYLSNKSIIKISFGKNDTYFTNDIKDKCRHKPMEIMTK